MTPADSPLPEPPSSLKDWRGVPFSQGTRIYYPFMSGRSAFMAEGVVESIEFVKEDMNEIKRMLKRGKPHFMSDDEWAASQERHMKRMRVKVMVRVKRRNVNWRNTRDVVAITRLDNITVV